MADVITYQRFWQRRDSAANWTSANPTLASGEIGFEEGTSKFKIGDGSTAWNSLNYYCAVPLADPGQDALVFWDDSVGTWSHLTLGTGLSIAGTVISSSGGGGGGGAMTLIGTATVAGSATTTLTLSGLDLSSYKEFYVTFAVDNATASGAGISMYFNSDTTATNYWREGISYNGATVSAGRVNDGTIMVMDASETATAIAHIIKDRDGKPRAFAQSHRNTGSGIQAIVQYHMWTSATNVTGITLSSSVANSLAVGSTFSVFGLA